VAKRREETNREEEEATAEAEAIRARITARLARCEAANRARVNNMEV